MRRLSSFFRTYPARAFTLCALASHLLVAASVSVAAGQAPAAPTQTGRTVWDGVFTDDQAERGRVAFAGNCAECHGETLGGGEAKALSGDRFWRDFQETTVDYVLGQISTNMPFSEDGSLAGTLPASMYQDILAHILRTNGFPAGSAELTRDSSMGIRIVRKDGSSELPASAFAAVVGCLAPGTGSNTWKLTNGSRPTRALAKTKPDPSNMALADREYPLIYLFIPVKQYVGHKMLATGSLVGPGGVKGIEVSDITSLGTPCP